MIPVLLFVGTSEYMMGTSVGVYFTIHVIVMAPACSRPATRQWVIHHKYKCDDYSHNYWKTLFNYWETLLSRVSIY